MPIKSWENKCLNEYLKCAPLSTGFVCDECIFTGHTVKVVDRFSGQEVELAAKHCQFPDLGILRLGRGWKEHSTLLLLNCRCLKGKGWPLRQSDNQRKLHLVQSWLLADEDEEDEAAAEEVDAPDRPQNKLCRWKTLGELVVAVGEIMGALEDPRNPHHYEQLAVKDLGTRGIVSRRGISSRKKPIAWSSLTLTICSLVSWLILLVVTLVWRTSRSWFHIPQWTLCAEWFFIC